MKTKRVNNVESGVLVVQHLFTICISKKTKQNCQLTSLVWRPHCILAPSAVKRKTNARNFFFSLEILHTYPHVGVIFCERSNLNMKHMHRGRRESERERGSECTCRAARPDARLPRRSSHSLPCKQMPPPLRQMLTFDLRSHASSEVLSLVDLSASSSHSRPPQNFISSSFYARFIATSAVERSFCPPHIH